MNLDTDHSPVVNVHGGVASGSGGSDMESEDDRDHEARTIGQNSEEVVAP